MNTLPLQALRILVVDDDRDSREMMVVALEGEGAAVVAVDSVEAALIAIADWQPDVLLSDIRMPGADGYALIQYIREKAIAVTAIATTAFARDDDRREALAAGFQAHLTKPIDLLNLYQTIVILTGRDRR